MVGGGEEEYQDAPRTFSQPEMLITTPEDARVSSAPNPNE